jgi:cell division septation protein DedD
MMNANSGGKQIEFDVFPKQDKSDYSYLAGIKEERNTPAPSVNLVLSTQSIIILFICVLMLLVASFALGVEKGRLTTARAESKPQATGPGTSEAAGTEPKATIPSHGAQNAADQTQKIQIAAATVLPQEIKETATVAPLSGYAIQIASLKSESSAKGLSEALTKKGYTAFVKPSGNYQVVLAGNFNTRDEAQGKLKELKKTYPDCFIKKI